MESRRSAWFAIVAVAVACAQTATGQAPASQARRAPVLDIASPITSAVTSRTTLVVRLRVDRGEFLRLDLRADGVDLRASLQRPSGAVVAASGRLRGSVSESIVLTAVADEALSVRLTAIATRREPGRLELRVAERRAATEADRQRVTAQRAYADGWARLESTPADASKAATGFSTAAMLWSQVGDPVMEARAWRALADAQERQGKFLDALDSTERRRDVSRASGDERQELWAVNDLARLQFTTSEEAASRDTLLDVVARWRRLGDRQGEAAARVQLGVYYMAASQKDPALEHFSLAVPMLERDGDGDLAAVAHQQFGNHYNTFGDRQRAEEELSKALAAATRLGDRRLEAGIRHDFGTLYNMLGEFELARAQFAASLTLARAAGDVYLEAHAMMNAGTNYGDLQEPARALRELEQAAPRLRQLGDALGEAVLMNSIATMQRDLGRPADALASLEAAHRLFAAVPFPRGTMITLTSLGYQLCEFRRFDEGRARLAEALQLARAATDGSQEALALSFLAGCESATGAHDDAIRHAEDAQALVERDLAQLAREDLRASFFSNARQVFERRAEVLVRLAARDSDPRRMAEAFDVSERAHARSMLELAPSLRQSSSAQLSPALVAERDALLTRLRTADQESAQWLAARDDYYRFRSRVRASDPRYASLVDPQTVTLGEAQAMLEPGTVVLEYLLGRTGGHVWAVSRDRVLHGDLPARAVIDRLARRMLRAVRQREVDRDEARVREADARYWRDAATLSRIVLGPVAGALRARKVYVVADGVLHLVPFASLPAPGSTVAAPKPLFLTSEVASIPSLSVFTASRREPSRAGTGGPIAVFADPVYDRNDPRMARRGERANGSPVQRKDQFGRLSWSGQEGRAIVAAAARTEVSLLTGTDATRESALGGRLNRFRIVHFNSHGVADSRRPEQSGLVLALYDAQRNPIDGRLNLLDVYNLQLTADLVVLSGCETALGREVDGEGVIGLTRGFLLAGAANVVSSHWQIRDASTVDFMKSFYDGLLRQGMSPPAALRRAQQRMWESSEWKSPYFWAAFSLYMS
jgi:CHAT domain-containing protein/tetratricopeptide (TPR) repeat protein